MFIRRPVMTVLLNLSLVIAGLAAWSKIPVAALPSYNTPIINTMASSVALPLEKQFSTIAGLQTISSTNTLGNTSLTLEFDPSRNIDAAAVDVQAALFRSLRALPAEMTSPPSYRKVNPADTPILTLAVTSNTLPLPQVHDLVDTRIAQKLAQIPGVGMVSLAGGQRPAIRVQINPGELASRGLNFSDVRAAITAASVNQPKGSFDGPIRTILMDANDQLRS
eukprot:gene10282-12602_t